MQTHFDHHSTYIFVYGTLLQGGANHHRLRGARLVAERASVPGWLFDTGKGYPALLPADETAAGETFADKTIAGETNACVFGELYEIDATILELLDELEDYYGAGDPRNEYERVRTKVRRAGDPEEAEWAAWTYVYPEAAVRECRPVDGGDWRLGTAAE